MEGIKMATLCTHFQASKLHLCFGMDLISNFASYSKLWQHFCINYTTKFEHGFMLVTFKWRQIRESLIQTDETHSTKVTYLTGNAKELHKYTHNK